MSVSPRIKFMLRLVAGIALLSFIVSRVNLSEIDLAPARVAIGIGGAAALILLSQGFAAWRWRLLLGEPAARWGYLARLYLISTFFSLMLPTTVGGDAVRAAAASRGNVRPASVVASVVLDRVFGVAGLLVWLVIGIAAAPDIAGTVLSGLTWNLPPENGAWLMLGVAVVLVAVLVLLRRSRRLARWSQEAHAAVLLVVRAPRVALAALLLAVVVQGHIMALWMLLAWSVGFDLPAPVFFVAVPFVSIGAMLPITLSGLGVREGVWLLLLSRYHFPPHAVVVFSLLYFGATLLVGAVGGTLFVTRGTGDGSEAGEARVTPSS